MRPLLVAGLSAVLLTACGDGELGSTNEGGGGSGGTTTTTITEGGAGSTATGSGGTTSSTSSTSTTTSLDELLAALRADLTGTLLEQSAEGGWPAPVEGGFLFVTTDTSLDKIAGDLDAWAGTALTKDDGFNWIVLDMATLAAGPQYKFTNLTDWVPDPWSRSYTYDDFGEMSLFLPKTVHLDRYFAVGDGKLIARTIRVLVPEKPATHVLYTHDGQNLFDPDAFFGGWKIQDTAPPAMLVVGIDNTPARMDEYTHVPDVIGGGMTGGLGDAYADYLQSTLRPLIQKHYGEPPKVGTMGSSLGGLISFHIADHLPGEIHFAASLSGTMGWGSIGNGIHNETIIERYAAHGHQSTVLYLDSGGDGGACGDTDGDGIDDDVDQGDNFCETAQLHDTLLSLGYVDDSDVTYVWDPGAQHNEAAWASRVAIPMQIFAGL